MRVRACGEEGGGGVWRGDLVDGLVVSHEHASDQNFAEKTRLL